MILSCTTAAFTRPHVLQTAFVMLCSLSQGFGLICGFCPSARREVNGVSVTVCHNERPDNYIKKVSAILLFRKIQPFDLLPYHIQKQPPLNTLNILLYESVCLDVKKDCRNIKLGVWDFLQDVVKKRRKL